MLLAFGLLFVFPVPAAAVPRVAGGYFHSVLLKDDGTVWAWGRNVFGQLGDGTFTDRPSPVQVKGPGGVGYLTGVVAIAAGSHHTLALRSDGTVWAWGRNDYGQLGDGTTARRLTPVQVKDSGGTGYLSGVTAIAAGPGSDHALALGSGGAVWAWGRNDYRQLGDGTTQNRTVPVQVYGPGGTGYLTGAVALAAGTLHSLALAEDGTVWAWGSNGSGRLGQGGDYGSYSYPVRVKGPGGVLSEVAAISAGSDFSLALRSDGTVWAWGSNYFSQIGNGTSWDVLSPLPVMGMSGVVALAGGGMHALAVKDSGAIWGWGLNNFRQLGGGPATQRSVPGPVADAEGGGAFGGVWAVAGGYAFSLALRSDGTVWAWGHNDWGALGEGSRAHRFLPFQVPGLTGVTQVAAGADHSLALRSDGTVWAWGRNTSGQLGDGTTITRTTPVQVLGPGGAGYLTGVVAVASRGYHSLALKSDGTVWAWGSNGCGQLGDGTTQNRTVPVQVYGPGGAGYLTGVVAIAAGRDHSLALRSDGTVWAWGCNGSGRLGDGTTINRSTPVQVVGPGGAGYLTGVIAVTAGSSHSLALKSDGTVWTWGYNGHGQLGDGTTITRTTPVQVLGPGGSGYLAGVVAVGAGWYHSLAARADGTAWAWGDNAYGTLGDGTTITRTTPVQVLGPGGAGYLVGVAALAGGRFHTLARGNDGGAWSWGFNGFGQRGDGAPIQSPVPTPADGDVLAPALTAFASPGEVASEPPAQVTVAVYADEPLEGSPVASLTASDGAVSNLDLWPEGPRFWSGSYPADSRLPGGLVTIAIYGDDESGNRGRSSFGFRRASPALADDGLVVGHHIPRFAPGRFGQAVRVEEGGANLVRNGSLETDTTVYWMASNNASAGDNGTVSLSSDAPVGRHSIEYTITYHPSWAYFRNDFFAYRMRPYFEPGKQYVLSFYARSVSGSTTLDVKISRGDSTNVVLSPRRVTLAPYWQRYVIPFVAAQAGEQPVVFFTLPSGATGTLRVGGLQLEEGNRATPVHPEGSTLAGDTLYLAGAALPAGEGTVEAWVYLDVAGASQERYWFDTTGPAGRRLEALILPDGRPALRYGAVGGPVELVGSAFLPAESWHHLAFTWSPAGVTLFADGSVVARAYSPPDLAVGERVYLGSRGDGTGQVNGLVDEFRLSRRARSEEEIRSAYESPGPLPSDEATLLRADFDGRLDLWAGFSVQDLSAPSISGFSPPVGGWSATARPVIGVAVSDASGIDPARIAMELDGQAVSPAFDPSTGAIRYTPPYDLTEGTHTVALIVYDVFGNAAAGTWSFSVDTVPPVLQVAADPDQVVPGQVVGVTVYASEALSGSPLVTVTLSGGSAEAVSLVPTEAGTWTGSYAVPSDSPSGWPLLHAEGVDPAGNRGGPVAAFSRNSEAYTDAAATVPAGRARFGPGRVGSALLIEEGTSNLLSAPCSSFEHGGLCWGYWGDVSRENVSDWAWHGQRSLKVTRTVTGGGGGGIQTGYHLTSPLVGDQYAFSGWIYAPPSMDGKTVRVQMSMRGGASPHNYASQTLILQGGQVHRFELVHAVDEADRTEINLQVAFIGDTVGDSVYLDGAQLEKKPYATSWHLGGGSRAAESLAVPAAGVHRAEEGTVEFWFTPGRTPQKWGRLFNRGSWSNPRRTDQLSVYYGTGWGLNKVGAEIGNGAAGRTAGAWVTLPSDLVPGRWYYLAFRWTLPGQVKLFLCDGATGQLYQSAKAVDFGAPSFSAYPQLYVGSSGPTIEHANAWFDELRISARARADGEILATCQGGLSLPWDGVTTFRMTFDGHVLVQRTGFTVLPGVAASPAGGFFNSPQTVTLVASEPAAIHFTTDGSEPGLSSPQYSVPLSVYADTVLRFLTVSEATGLVSPVHTERYLIDQIPPTWPDNSLLWVSDVGTGSLVLHWTPAQDDRGVAAYAVYREGQLLATVAGEVYAHVATGLEEGAPYEFRVEAKDFAGNWSPGGPAAVFSTARVPPVVGQRVPGPGDIIPGRRPEVGATVTDDGAGVDWGTLTLVLDGQAVVSIYDEVTGRVSYFPPADLDPGLHAVALLVYDRAANQTEDTWTFTVDPEAPEITGLRPGSGQKVSTAHPAVGAVVYDDTGVDWEHLVLQLDGLVVEAVYDAVYGSVFYTPATGLAEGTHTVALLVYDLAGNPGLASWSFVVDLTPPILELELSPPPAGSATWTVAIRTSEPLLGPPTVTVLGPDGQRRALEVSYTGGNTWSASYTVARSGTHVVTATAFDRAGNATSVQGSFTQVLGGPLAIVGLVPAPGSSVVSRHPLIGFSVDTENGVDEVGASLDSQPITMAYDPAADLFYYLPAAPLADGSHTVAVWVYDGYGNLASASWNFSVDVPSGGGSASGGLALPGRIIPAGPRPKPRPLSSPPQFRDIGSAWGRVEIEELVAYGLVQGTGGELFQPLAPLRLKHLVLVLERIAQSLETAGWLSSDESAHHGVEEWAIQNDRVLERRELARIVVGFGDRLKLRSWPGLPPDPPAFYDLEGLGEEERQAVEEAARRGLMIGRPGGIFDPRSPVTREEGAATLARLWRAVLAQEP